MTKKNKTLENPVFYPVTHEFTHPITKFAHHESEWLQDLSPISGFE